MKIKLSNVIGIWIQTVLIIIAIGVNIYYLGDIYEVKETLFKVLALYSFINLLAQIIINTMCKIRLISSYNIIILLSYLYNCGQVWLLGLDIPLKKNSFIITYNSTPSIIGGLLIFIMLINCINMGGIIYKTISKFGIKTEMKNSQEYSNNYDRDIVYRLGLVIFIIFGFILLTNDINQIKVALTINSENIYALTYKIGRDNPLIYLSMYIFPISVFMILISTKNKFIKSVVLSYVIIRSLIMMLIIGSRSAHIPMIVSLIIYYIYNNGKRISYKKILLYVVVLVTLYTLVSATRNNINKFDIQTIITYIKNNNIFVDILQELGSTQNNIILLYDNCPRYLEFAYGKSYVGSFLKLLPGGGLFPVDFSSYIDIGNILNSYFHKGQSLGGSYISELYYNFGWLSIFISPVIGLLFMRVEIILNIRKFNLYLYKSIALYLFYTLCIYIRAQSYDLLLGIKISIYILIGHFIIKNICIKQREKVDV